VLNSYLLFRLAWTVELYLLVGRNEDVID